MGGDPRHFAELLASRIPLEVRKAIDNREFNDRLIEAARLGGLANDPGLTPAKRKEARDRAQQVLTAVPRAQTERLVAQKVSKAAQLGNGSAADALRRQAREILERNPPAPRRTPAVRKAKEDPPVPVFDAQGNLVGVVDPDDLMPVSGAGKPKPAADSTQQPPAAAAQQAAPAAPDAPVAKGGMTRVYDQHGRPRLVPPLSIVGVGKKRVTKAAPAKGMVRVTDDDGRSYWADPADLKGPGSPEAQARNAGPVKAGGTTGLGQPRKTGPAGSLPADGPQAALPGDVEARTIIKSLGPGWRMLFDHGSRLRGAVRQEDIRPARPGHVLKGAAAGAWTDVCNRAGRRVGIAPAAGIIPLADLRTAARVAKSLGSAGSGPGVPVPAGSRLVPVSKSAASAGLLDPEFIRGLIADRQQGR